MSQYATSLTIKGSIIKSAYIYAQVFMEETTVNITAPSIVYTTAINAPVITGACSPITLSFNAQPTQLTSWKYSWRISYISGSYSVSDKKNAEDYFSRFKPLSDAQRIITLSGEYSYPDSTLWVICTAQNNINPKMYYFKEAFIKIEKSAPIVVFAKKLSLLDILKGGNKNTLPITIYKSSCSDSNSKSRLLQSTDKTIIDSDIKIWFEIRSGKQKSNISTRGIEEMTIEKKLLERFNSNSILSVSDGDTFKYYTFYNITVFAQYKSVASSSMIASDSEIFVMTRKDPLCKISSSGLIINPYGSPSILALKSSLSEIDYEKGEEIIYLWSCESCRQLLNGNNCSCEIFDTQLQRKTRDLALSPGILLPYCIYTISLVITVQNSKIADSATRSCYQSIKLATHPQARSGIKGSNRKGGNPEVTFFVADFDLEVSNAINLKKDIASVEWDLLEIKNPRNFSDSYSIMNKYISGIFKKDFNMVIDQSLIESSVKQIPSEYIPTPVAVSKSYPPILGIKRNQLICRNCEYVYAIKIIYKNGLSPVTGAISFKSPSSLDKKELKIEPIKGKGYQTVFSFIYFSTSQNDDNSDDDGTTGQFYRLDCPEEFKGLLEKNSKFKKISLKLRLTSAFSTTLAPGLLKCNYTVLIKMVVTKNYESIEANKTIIIEPATSSEISKNIIEDQNQVKEKIILAKINDIYSNNTQMTIFQKLSLMSQVAQSGVTSGNITARGISYLNDFSHDKLADTLDNVDNEEGVGIIENVAESLESFITLSPELITSDLANITLNIVDNLINKTISLSDTHGSEALQSIVGTISGIAQINEKNQYATKSDFNQKLNTFLNNVVDLKFNESMPGEPANNISSPNIQISIKSQMVSDLIASSNDSKGIISKTETNQSVIVPPNLIQVLAASNENSILINATLENETSSNLVFSNALIASAYNTFDSIKQNSLISVKSLDNNSLENGTIKPSTIEKIYIDLKNSSKLDSSINKVITDSKVIQMTFKLATYSANAGQQVISQNVGVGSLPDQNKLVVELDINSNSSSDEDSSLANSTQIPMYYVEENKTWTNEGCSLEAGEQNASLGNKSQIYNSTSIHKRISCNTIGKKQKITPRVALIIAVDVIKNVWNAIKGGNYQMLINFGSLTNLSATNSAGLVIGLGIILAISICSIILKVKDNQALYLARVDALNAYFENRTDTEIKEEGFLVDLKNFFAEIRKKGFLNSQSANQSKNDQAQIASSGEKKVEKSTTPVISLINKPKKAPLPPKPNGFTILTKKEEKELKALYATMKYEALPIYGRMKTLENFKDEISENKILSRKTITYLENMKEQKQTTFFGLLIVI